MHFRCGGVHTHTAYALAHSTYTIRHFTFYCIFLLHCYTANFNNSSLFSLFFRAILLWALLKIDCSVLVIFAPIFYDLFSLEHNGKLLSVHSILLVTSRLYFVLFVCRSPFTKSAAFLRAVLKLMFIRRLNWARQTEKRRTFHFFSSSMDLWKTKPYLNLLLFLS